MTRYGVKTVLEEGYEGPVPTEDYFGFIQDAAVKRKVAGVFMDRLMLGGAEYAHINRDRDFDLVGADDAKLFTENIEWYREAAKEKDQTAAELADLQEHIGRLAGRRFPTALKKWMKLRDKFDKGLLNLPDYVRQFSRIEAPLAGSHMEMLLRALNSAGPESLRTAEEIDPKKLFLEIISDRKSSNHVDWGAVRRRINSTEAWPGKQVHFYLSLAILAREYDLDI